MSKKKEDRRVPRGVFGSLFGPPKEVVREEKPTFIGQKEENSQTARQHKKEAEKKTKEPDSQTARQKKKKGSKEPKTNKDQAAIQKEESSQNASKKEGNVSQTKINSDSKKPKAKKQSDSQTKKEKSLKDEKQRGEPDSQTKSKKSSISQSSQIARQPDNQIKKSGGRKYDGRSKTWVKKTYRIEPGLYQQLERMAYWTKKDKQEILNRALERLFKEVKPELLKPTPDEQEESLNPEDWF